MKIEELIEEAEKEGAIKQFISEELKEKPRYGRECDCGVPVRYSETIGDTLAMRLMCLRCGGMLLS